MSEPKPRESYRPDHLFEAPGPPAGACGHVVGDDLGWPIYCHLPRSLHPFPPPKVHIPLEPEDGP